jgi:hypothetical protein
MKPIRFVLFTALAMQCFLAANLPNAEESFDRLKELAGAWKLVNPKSVSQEAFRISYRPISRDTALVETYGNPAGSVTETIYHLNGDRLMATHYCAQGNQPRLLLVGDSTTAVLHFAFLDVTNLKKPNASHLVDMRFTFLPEGRLQREETYLEDGQKDVSTLLLKRAN